MFSMKHSVEYVPVTRKFYINLYDYTHYEIRMRSTESIRYPLDVIVSETKRLVQNHIIDHKKIRLTSPY